MRFGLTMEILLCSLLIALVSWPQGATGEDQSWIDIARVDFAHNDVDVVINHIEFHSATPFQFLMWHKIHPLPKISSRQFTDCKSIDDKYVISIDRLALNSSYMETERTFGLFVPFPYQRYIIEIVFGFNVSLITIPERTVTGILGDRWKEGRWNSSQEFEVSTIHNPLLVNQYVEIEQHNLMHFITLRIILRHVDPYIHKMFIPVWGPFILSLLVYIGQIILAALRRLTIGDHLRLVLAIALFSFSSMITVREVTPSEVTLSEAFVPGLAFIYLLTIFSIVGKKWRIRDA